MGTLADRRRAVGSSQDGAAGSAMLPFEFTGPGPPVSHQSGNKSKLAAWRNLVRVAAAGKWGKRAPRAEPLKISVTYYHEGEAIRIDNDNMVKPIQDALIG